MFWKYRGLVKIMKRLLFDFDRGRSRGNLKFQLYPKKEGVQIVTALKMDIVSSELNLLREIFQ